jgi:hypothetical protein
MNDNLPTCSTRAECDANDGKRVQVVGVYTVFDPLPKRKRDHPPARHVKLVLGGEDGPFLEPYWHDGAERPADEIARYEGKKVRVVGKFMRDMPPRPGDPPHAAAMGGPCLHPVESVTLAE